LGTGGDLDDVSLSVIKDEEEQQSAVGEEVTMKLVKVSKINPKVMLKRSSVLKGESSRPRETNDETSQHASLHHRQSQRYVLNSPSCE